MKLEYAKNPKWSDITHKNIDLLVRFEGIDEELEFTASAEDSELHGREIFMAAIEGKFGEIADYTPSSISQEDLAVQARTKRNKLLLESDWTQLTDVISTMDTEKLQKWNMYRQNLRNITDQENFPKEIIWPIKP